LLDFQRKTGEGFTFNGYRLQVVFLRRHGRGADTLKRWVLILWLCVILGTGAFFRLWRLGSNPPALFRDEAEKGYTALCLARLGGYFYFDGPPGAMDLAFTKWPVFIDVMGVHTSAIYQYSAAPFVGLFGLNEWTTRLPAALAGILTILAVFALVRRWTGDEAGALLSAFFLAVSPWHVLFSRWAQQGIFLPFLITCALILLHKGIREREEYLAAVGFVFALAFYTYAVARLFIPLFVIILTIILWKELKPRRKWFYWGALAFTAISVPLLLFYMSGGRSERLSRIFLFGGGRTIAQSLHTLASNYYAHFSPAFLFFRGDRELRHSLPGMGQMYFFEAPLLIYGLWHAVRRKDAWGRILTAWLITYPVSAALTNEGIPHALRAITGLPVVHIITGTGAATLFKWLKPYNPEASSEPRPWYVVPARSSALKYLQFLIIFIIIVNVVHMGRNLFINYPSASAPNWQYGVKQAIEKARGEGVPPERVFISGAIPYAPYLVMAYTEPDPERLREEGLRGLGYSFLPPAPVETFWSRAPVGAWMILPPARGSGIRPKFIIEHLPPKSGPHIHQTAFEIFVKE